MELMDHDLRYIINSRLEVLPEGFNPFAPIVAIDIMLQIGQAMLYLRDHGILHRDLKAKNVLVNLCKPLALQVISRLEFMFCLISHDSSNVGVPDCVMTDLYVT